MREQVVFQDEVNAGRAPNEERRASVRYPTNRSGACRPVGKSAETSWPARIRDVSSLGIGLVFAERPELGAVLEINIEGPQGTVARTLIARVVHIEPEDNGRWIIGCAFTLELDNSELKLFQAEKVKPGLSDGRRWMRFPCNVETVCYTCTTAPGERSAARILNISPGGIGLLLPCQFEVGTLLHFELPASLGQVPRKMLVRVVRAFERANGDWFLGCEFAQLLDDEELRFLI